MCRVLCLVHDYKAAVFWRSAWWCLTGGAWRAGKLMRRTLTFPRGPVRGTLVNPTCVSHLQECRWNEGQVTPSLGVAEAREDGNWQTTDVFSQCLQLNSWHIVRPESNSLLRDVCKTWSVRVSEPEVVSSVKVYLVFSKGEFDPHFVPCDSLVMASQLGHHLHVAHIYSLLTTGAARMCESLASLSDVWGWFLLRSMRLIHPSRMWVSEVAPMHWAGFPGFFCLLVYLFFFTFFLGPPMSHLRHKTMRNRKQARLGVWYQAVGLVIHLHAKVLLYVARRMRTVHLH